MAHPFLNTCMLATHLTVGVQIRGAVPEPAAPYDGPEDEGESSPPDSKS